jgi:hypothetical protein
VSFALELDKTRLARYPFSLLDAHAAATSLESRMPLVKDALQEVSNGDLEKFGNDKKLVRLELLTYMMLSRSLLKGWPSKNLPSKHEELQLLSLLIFHQVLLCRNMPNIQSLTFQPFMLEFLCHDSASPL